MIETLTKPSTSRPARLSGPQRVDLEPASPQSITAASEAGKSVRNSTAASAARPDFAASSRNIRMTRVLRRIVERFNRAGIPIMALKGAALNLTIYDRPDARPMTDLDLMVKPEHVERATRLLEQLGCLRGETLVREDFFPRFHYELAYAADPIYPVRIDLHVRPLRPLRFARLVPPNALWERADAAQIGDATVLIPSAEDMLIHLMVHAAVHGDARRMWLEDIRRWAKARRADINWTQFIENVRTWRLALPVRQTLARVEDAFGPLCPPEVRQRLFELPVNWRDRLALFQAPRDSTHPAAHVAVNLLTTPGLFFVLGYLRAVALPDRNHMGEWYIGRHPGWLPYAHLLRWLRPLIRRDPRYWARFSKIETGRSSIHGMGVRATRRIAAGELIARYSGRRVDHDGPYVVPHRTSSGGIQRYELTGKLKFLNHSCRPNATLRKFALIALTHIHPGQEILVDYGPDACDCPRNVSTHARTLVTDDRADAAWSKIRERFTVASAPRGRRHGRRSGVGKRRPAG